MTLSYILNFDQLFVQRNPAIGPMTGGRDPYVERLTQAYQEFSDRKDTLKMEKTPDFLAMGHHNLLCHILKKQIENEQKITG